MMMMMMMMTYLEIHCGVSREKNIENRSASGEVTGEYVSIEVTILPRDVMLARYMRSRLSVCPKSVFY